MMRASWGFVAVMLAASVGATVSRTPREVARQLLADDFAALNRGELSLAEVGTNACRLAESAELSVREVLLAGAVRLHARAGDGKGLSVARRRLEELRQPFAMQGDEAVLRLGELGELVFVRCPTGAVDLVHHIQGTESTRVRLTRPYWIMKYPLTRRQAAFYPPLEPPTKDKRESAYECLNRVQAERLCAYFTERFGSRLPPGHVIRLPTLAEWEYAFHAGGGPDAFADLRTVHHRDALGSRIYYDYGLDEPRRQKLCNAWGIGDWCLQEKVLDVVDARLLSRGSSGGEGFFQVRTLPPPVTREDPVYTCTNEHAVALIRMPSWARWKAATRAFGKDYCPFRLVIAQPVP